ncbi:lipopolysaccharide-induced tumor necrosis factor-alpha factor homolog isoform X2 [Anabas testudineus]|uniref:lipopolysaccharide-induced tumor necrosis factor-alpha factor homolog isoform X2 n=1 Tax=Anabas testudineus TaxID=64144 RepID=UPI000E463431|nr:lipopolysaccharide-induced tumor necrosis factor-alpha factor homolog isoform X2 [Anabas testudineus]
MESLFKVDESFPTPPPYFLPESQTGREVRITPIHSFISPSLPLSCSTQTHSSLPVSDPPPPTPMLKFVSYEAELHHYPAPTTCHSCQTQVITQVTYKVGRHVWIMCLVFVLCGLVLGCCLIPFFLNRFKDAYHTCPRCQLVLYVHRKTCCA